MNKIVLASGNRGKLAELQNMLAPLALQIIAQGELGVPEAVENASSFVENALIKARNAAAHTGLPAIADDSGLAVDALGGAPGIYSARYSGAAATDASNNEKLLQALTDVEDNQRGASFYCALVYVRRDDDPVPIICQGRWAGRILRRPRGEAGFGYDPLFWVDNENASAAELPKQTKNAISHRGQAMAALVTCLRDL